MARIIDLPSETIEEILLHCDPLDVASYAQTSRWFRLLIYEPADDHFWRALYLAQPFDDPRTCISQNARRRDIIPWKIDLQRIIKARTIIRKTIDENSSLRCYTAEERVTVLRTLLDMVRYVPPLSTAFDRTRLSCNLLWVAAILRGSTFLDNPQWSPAIGDEESQLRAQLHTYFGLTQADTRRTRRVESRAYVYWMLHYRSDNSFGPFMMDGSGRVNWVHINAIHHVVSMHIVDLHEDEEFAFTIFPLSLPFTQAVIPGGLVLDEVEDWAGVEGWWNCSFCFCDHRELLLYNEMPPGAPPIGTAIFEHPSFREVFRTLSVEIRVTGTTPDRDHPTRPKISFAGEMGGHSEMKGWVQMTPDEQIRWHFDSGEHGNAIWSSEGIQIGGIRSAFGILGSWTTVFHDEDDPVGPFWLRKSLSGISEAATP